MRTASRLMESLALLPVTIVPLPADQPQWGEWHSRNMVSGEQGLPVQFDPETGENVKWSVPLGTQTHSSPVIAGGRVLIGTNNGQQGPEFGLQLAANLCPCEHGTLDPVVLRVQWHELDETQLQASLSRKPP